MRSSFLFLACLGFLCGISQSQGNIGHKFKEDFTEANLLMQEGYYNQALELWLQLYNEDPANANLNFKVGISYLHSVNDKDKALPYLEFAERSRTSAYSSFKTTDYDPFDSRERNAPNETGHYLAEACLLNYELDKAQVGFMAAADDLGKKHILYEESKRGLEMTNNAKRQLANPRMDITIINMGPVINDEYNDFSPVISVDENALFFTSRRLRTDSTNANLIDFKTGQYYEDIYVAYKDRDGQWQAPELLSINEPSYNSATINVSIDGQELFVYKDTEGGGDIFQSSLIGETWSYPEKLSSDINTSNWETHSAKTADGNTMYFVSDRPGGYGGRDIYRVVKLPNGQWSKALNIGPKVNTMYDDDAPFIHPDGKSLYFASKGHTSMGGFDIFSTRSDEKGDWTSPENIGYPINTVDDDIFFVTSADSRRAYFSSDRDGGFGRKDIYMVELPVPEDASNLAVLKGFIVPAEGQKIPASTAVLITDIETGETTSYRPRMRDGVFVAILKPCKDYEISYVVDDRTIQSEKISVDCKTAYSEIQRELLLDPVNLHGSVVKVITSKGMTTRTDNGVTQVQSNNSNQTTVVTTKDDVAIISASPKGTAIFDKYFGYNEKDINLEEARYQLFMNALMDMITKNGSVELEIEGSASRVPTKTWKTNDILANNRANDAKGLIMNEINKRGIDPTKVRISSVKGLIQGPNYKGDFDSNKGIYEKYQYIRIIVK